MSRPDHDEARALAGSILGFCRALRESGLERGTDTVISAVRALALAGISSEEDTRHALRAVLVRRPEELALFESAFALYLARAGMLGHLGKSPDDAAESLGDALDAARRLLEAKFGTRAVEVRETRTNTDATGSYSRNELLGSRDFEQMSLEEQRQAKQVLAGLAIRLPPGRSRRFRSAATGLRPDFPATMRSSLSRGGELVRLVRRDLRPAPARIVLIADVSGSMSVYSRMFLMFSHSLARSNACTTEVFVFATRLTRVTRALASRDPDVALGQAAEQVADWDSGTRIAESLRTFNHDWSRRVLSRPATVVLLSDGLEREQCSGLEFEMARLKRSCKRLIWINPLLRYAQFQPRAHGIRSMLGHVDEFRPAHNLDCLLDLSDCIVTGRRQARTWTLSASST